MRLRVLTATILVLSLVGGPALAFADDAMTPAALVIIDRERDGTRVTIEGEAIGEDLHADSRNRWVNILGGGTAVGVFMLNQDAGIIGSYGGYAQSGDVLRVTGVVNVACAQHAGEFDVHAEQVEIVSRGSATTRTPEPWKGVVGIVGVLVFIAQTRWFRYRATREA